MVSPRGEWVAKHRDKVMSLPNVVGCGWGTKRVGGRKTEEEGLVVFVTRKVPREQLHPRHTVPLQVGDVPTDVVETGSLRLLAAPRPIGTVRNKETPPDDFDRTARWRPAPPGVSFGHASVTAGTLGAAVRHRVTGEVYFLSNNHVAANGSDGGDGRAQRGDPVLQPGAYDGGTLERDVIGHLAAFVPLHPTVKPSPCRWAHAAERLLNGALRVVAKNYSVRFVRNTTVDNAADCALVKPVKPADASGDVLGLGTVKGLTEAEVGMAVRKSGRTTAVTSGEVVALGASFVVGLGDDKTARFADQIVTTPLARPGDSGSLVLDESNRAVGLLFAGSDKATLCNPISVVCSLLDVQF